MKKKICTKCKLFVEAEECPLCRGNQFASNWKGRFYILNPNRSLIAQKLSLTAKGEYAIKI